MANADGAVQEASVSVATTENTRRHRAGQNPRGRTVDQIVAAYRTPTPASPAATTAPAPAAEDRR